MRFSGPQGRINKPELLGIRYIILWRHPSNNFSVIKVYQIRIYEKVNDHCDVCGFRFCS
jgi:hypothetical protein